MINLNVNKADNKSPRVMIITGPPKIGKSTILAALSTNYKQRFPNGVYIISTDIPDGYKYLDYVGSFCSSPKQFNDTISELCKMEKKPDVVVVDTVTTLDDWSEPVGTLRYMRKPQGKNFNVILDVKGNPTYDENGRVRKYKPSDPEFESVHEIPEGRGYMHSRAIMVNWFRELVSNFNMVILVAHVKDIYIGQYMGEAVQAKDLNLTGKVKNIYTSMADAIGVIVPKENERYLSFMSKNSKSLIEGSRCTHLADQMILISKKNDKGEIETFWENIYI